jgi:hypothetical protein
MSLVKTILTKIGFDNGSQPAINDTNLNQMQTNIQTAISTLETNIENAIVDNLTSIDSKSFLSAKQGKVLNDKIADTGWVNFTLSNGWENLGGNYPPAQYRKIGKQVFLRGLIKNNSSNTTVLLNLNSSIKPLKTMYSIATESDVVKPVYIETSGSINIENYTKGDWVSLGNISYFID